MHKIAVLMAGPVRYAPLVVSQLETALNGIDFEIFALIWKQDLGNKRRDRDRLEDIAPLLSNPRVSACIAASPLPEEFYRSSIGMQTGSHSTINATMGMFYSMSALYRYVEQLPNRESFTHAFRIRTDCLLITKNLAEKLDFRSRVLTVSDNPFLPISWLSDHITFGTWRDFGKLWAHDSIESIYEAYRIGKLNPEHTLAMLARRRARGVQIKPTLTRFVDYHIVYTPAREYDPTWIKRALAESGVESLFADLDVLADQEEIARMGLQIAKKRASLEHQTRIYVRSFNMARRALLYLVRR